MSRSFPNLNIWENSIKKEQKGQVISIINAIDNDYINIRNPYTKEGMINSLKKSLDHILHDDYKQKAGMPVNCDVPNRGRKHFYEHRSLNDNVSLSFRPYYDSSRDRVEKIIDVYSRGNCNGSLKYNVENSQQIRFTKGSPDNIMSRKFVASGEYVVMKFNKVQSLSPKLKFKINK